MAMPIPNDLHLPRTPSRRVVRLQSVQKAFLKEALVLARGAFAFELQTLLESFAGGRVDVRFGVGFLAVISSQDVSNRSHKVLCMTYSGIWKNIMALGFASLECCEGVCPIAWRLSNSPDGSE
jgi:hypothetical protein